jgi:MoaA/NifB/PqqE/SkfB family radical SAM enzyme
MCTFHCGPHITDPPIKIDLVEKVLAEIAQQNIRLEGGVSVTGGEPTLETALCCEIVELVKDYNHECILNTNGQFATSFDAASSFLTKLRDYGLNVLAISWDEEHIKHNNVPKRVSTALAAASELNFDYVILSSVTAYDNTAAFNRILKYVKDTFNVKLNHAGKLEPKATAGGMDFSDVAPNINQYLSMYRAIGGSPLIRMRSYCKIGHKHFWDLYTPRFSLRELATKVAPCLRAPMLYPNGGLHMCVSPEMLGGNLERESLKDIYSRYGNNKVCNLLREGGAEGLIRYVQFIDAFTGSHLFNRKWSCMCEVCLYLHQQYIPKLIEGNPGLKCVQNYFPFHDANFKEIELNIPPQNVEVINALKKNVDAIWEMNTYKTCTNSIRESWEPLVKDPTISALIETWNKERRAS